MIKEFGQSQREHRARVPEPAQSLVDAMAHGDAIAIVGFGLSHAARAPDWESLLLQLIEEAQAREGVSLSTVVEAARAVEHKDLTGAASLLKSALGRDFQQVLIEQSRIDKQLSVTNLCQSALQAIEHTGHACESLIRSPRARTWPEMIDVTDIHRLLGQLPFAAILTTSYDTVLERSCPGSLPVYSCSNPQWPATASRGQKFVLKLHGDIHHTNDVTLTREDYERDEFAKLVRPSLRKLVSKKTLVWLGYRDGDPDLELLRGGLELDGGHALVDASARWHLSNGKFDSVVLDSFEQVERFLYKLATRTACPLELSLTFDTPWTSDDDVTQRAQSLLREVNRTLRTRFELKKLVRQSPEVRFVGPAGDFDRVREALETREPALHRLLIKHGVRDWAGSRIPYSNPPYVSVKAPHLPSSSSPPAPSSTQAGESSRVPASGMTSIPSKDAVSQESAAPYQLIRPAIDPPWKYPQAALALELLRFVMAGNERALFESGAPADDPDNVDSPYRATVFWPVKLNNDGEERLYPFLRARLGADVKECTSAIYFLKHEIFAGEAWSKINDVLVRENLPALSDCSDRTSWQRKWVELLKVEPRVVAMTGRGSGYGTRVRSVACVGLSTAYGPLVLCIDSIHRQAFESTRLTAHAKGKYQSLNSLLGKVIPDRVREHRDFWTWVIEAASWWRLAILGPVSSIVAGVQFLKLPLAVSWVNPSGLGSIDIAAWCWFVAQCILMFWLPRGYRALSSSDASVRVQYFVGSWHRAWFGLCLAQAALAFHGVEGVRQSIVGSFTGFFAPVCLLVASMYLLACCSALGGLVIQNMKLGERAEDVANGVALGVSGKLTPFVLVLGVGSVLGAFWEHVAWLRAHPQLAEFARMGPAAIFHGVALCMLVGRLGSRLMGTPTTITALLYLGAVLWPLSSLYSLLAPAPSAAAVGVASALGLGLQALLFVVVLWAIQGRAIERYIRSVEQAAWSVPWRSFSDAWMALVRVCEKGAKNVSD